MDIIHRDANESDWNNGNYSSKSFPTEFVKKLKSMFVDDWKNEMILKTSSEPAGQGKLSFYCKIKKRIQNGKIFVCYPKHGNEKLYYQV